MKWLQKKIKNKSFSNEISFSWKVNNFVSTVFHPKLTVIEHNVLQGVKFIVISSCYKFTLYHALNCVRIVSKVGILKSFKTQLPHSQV